MSYMATNKNGFQDDKYEAVYNWLTEAGSERVAIEVTNILSCNQVHDLYDGLVADDEIEETDY